ncbi:MAG: sensor histidine kinase [bacterium]
MKMRISTKLSLFLLLASLLPLLLFGGLSLWQLRKATMISVTQGNANVSRRAAEQIEQYVKNALSLLEATTENINHADLKDWQKERILRNYINRFEEFNELTVFDLKGNVVATSRFGEVKRAPLLEEGVKTALGGHSYLSPVFIKEDLTPAMIAAYPIYRLTEVSGVLAAELNLLEMWRLVDSIKVGESGIVHVIDADGYMVATGSGKRKMDVFQRKKYPHSDRLSEILRPEGSIFWGGSGQEMLAVGKQLGKPLQWTVLVSQPTQEAFSLATRIGYLLLGIMIVILLVSVGLGYYAGRREVVHPIQALSKATEEISRGNLEYRVQLQTGDEFTRLGEAFNQMAIRLKELQEKLIREEKHALFGRIASGLAHDLKHPIQAIETTSRLMEKLYQDPDFRMTFRKTVDREFAKVNLFLRNLHNLTHEIPHHPAPIKFSQLITETLATFEPEAAKQGIRVTLDFPSEEVVVNGDFQGLNRAFSNLISNALQAMKRGGDLFLKVEETPGGVKVKVQDTGMGIAEGRLKTLFEDFVTTKRHGLGLGLAITKKIISQHGGKIEVESEVGKGTAFSVTIPYDFG